MQYIALNTISKGRLDQTKVQVKRNSTLLRPRSRRQRE